MKRDLGGSNLDSGGVNWYLGGVRGRSCRCRSCSSSGRQGCWYPPWTSRRWRATARGTPTPTPTA
eukprot:1804634-Rhodomonas_salina.2